MFDLLVVQECAVGGLQVHQVWLDLRNIIAVYLHLVDLSELDDCMLARY